MKCSLLLVVLLLALCLTVLACGPSAVQGPSPDDLATLRQTENMGPDGAAPANVPTPVPSNTAAGIPQRGMLSYAPAASVEATLTLGPAGHGESGPQAHSGAVATH